MDQFLAVLFFLLLALALSRAALSPQAYWHSVLPNTPMPGAITDLLTSATLDEKTTVTVGKGKPGGTNVHVSPGGLGVHVGPKGHTRPPVGLESTNNGWNMGATETQLHIATNVNVTLYFLAEDIHPGAKMTLHFTKTTSSATLLSRATADSIPFSSAKLPEIRKYFSIQPNSVEDEAIKKTLLQCEEPATKGEKKYCATSLESMVEFATSSLGTRNVLALSTTFGKKESPKQQYTITAGGVQRLAGDELVVCHSFSERYTYAVFYCHLAKSTASKVKMIGKDGTAVEAVAVCHTDTAGWNPKHLAFQVLNVKPGTVPICHFLSQENVMWTRSS